MKTRFTLLPLLLAGLLSGAPLLADEPDRADHFKGLEADTLEQALENYAEYNQRLTEVLSADTLSTEDMVAIHELTYTLENALERIQEETERLAWLLEEIHLGSEHYDEARIRENAPEYLEKSNLLTD
ncbi:DUF6746 family protein [Alkalilimnicola ehrlichii MLHE-1]|uniref:Uncharacterized protein n=1 Tax=Alkalilimnicola ehrlichii (strain ATCC BAA-1101 / DSM 17681 / MLHE-1) TaxID=187272 RepID=Q0AB96_ALKEH|nr:DUF6746 family protein [Alkalilimnicola ehrlichii]ABI55891.1 conserved hypothetical protein [Alkalilimnicola ehrlichii MLHE-1]